MKTLPPIFIISLKNSPRRDVIKQRMDGLNLAFKFFDATYGKDLTEAELKEIDREFSQKRFSTRKPMTLGEIGCAISHIRLYEYIVSQNIPTAIILEDDAIVSHDFEKIVLKALEVAPDRNELIFLDHGKGKFWPITKKLIEYYKLVRYRYPSKNSKRCIFMADAYLLTLNGAKKLLAQAYPIRMPADYLTGAIHLTGIHAYGVEPPCVFRGAVSEIDSIELRN